MEDADDPREHLDGAGQVLGKSRVILTRLSSVRRSSSAWASESSVPMSATALS